MHACANLIDRRSAYTRFIARVCAFLSIILIRYTRCFFFNVFISAKCFALQYNVSIFAVMSDILPFNKDWNNSISNLRYTYAIMVKSYEIYDKFNIYGLKPFLLSKNWSKFCIPRKMYTKIKICVYIIQKHFYYYILYYCLCTHMYMII